MNIKPLIQRAVEASIGGDQQAAADLIKQSIRAKARGMVSESHWRRGDEDFDPHQYSDDGDPYEEIANSEGCRPATELGSLFEEDGLFFDIPVTRFKSEEQVIRATGIKIVNDTKEPDFLKSLQAAYAPLEAFITKCEREGDWINGKEVDRKALSDLFATAYVEQPVGQDDYYSISKLAQIMPRIVELIDRGTFHYADARQDWADGEEERADPYGFRGLRRSDF